MSKNYYYLIAGMPDISMDDARTVCTKESFLAEYAPELSDDDRRCTDLLLLEDDNRALLALLADGEAVPESRGLFEADELREMIRAARQDEKWDSRWPMYIHDFVVACGSDEQDGTLMVDRLSSYYYAYAMESENTFVSEWFRFNLDVNNIFAALTARKYGLNVASCVVGDGEVAEALRTNGSRDFGLGGTFERMEEVMRIFDTGDLVEREHQTDALRWKWLDDMSFFNFFGVEKIFGFLVKNSIVERWMKLDANIGATMLRSMIAQMKDVNVPEEFKV